MKRLDLAIDSDLGNVSLVAVAVNRVCQQLGLDSLRAGQVELCIAEATTNAIRHAYHGASGHEVGIMVAADPEQLLIEVSDSGSPMPLEEERRLLCGTPISEEQLEDRHSLPEGGRGLQIIHDMMDKVSYVRGEGRNFLRMVKRLGERG